MVNERSAAMPEAGAEVWVKVGQGTVSAVVVCTYDEGSGPRITVEIPHDPHDGPGSRTLTVHPERVRPREVEPSAAENAP
jgi:hypothetical protein